MNYSINVSRNGLHLFRANLSGCLPENAAIVAKEIQEKFDDCEVTLYAEMSISKEISKDNASYDVNQMYRDVL